MVCCLVSVIGGLLLKIEHVVLLKCQIPLDHCPPVTQQRFS
uniref:Uncharacterized protein n=1 Tax=Anguilla anguilla TaxID=7936 RepID=A0A0E9S277_ANGAN